MEGILLRKEDDKRYLRFFLDNGTYYNTPTEMNPLFTGTGYEFKWRARPKSVYFSDVDEHFKVGGPKCLIKW